MAPFTGDMPVVLVCGCWLTGLSADMKKCPLADMKMPVGGQ